MKWILDLVELLVPQRWSKSLSVVDGFTLYMFDLTMRNALSCFLHPIKMNELFSLE
jgi:hypothetical protein